jgi:hypothetical protein
MLRLGDRAQARGDLFGATEMWSAARPLFERSLQKKGVLQIDERMKANRTGIQGELIDKKGPIVRIP